MESSLVVIIFYFTSYIKIIKSATVFKYSFNKPWNILLYISSIICKSKFGLTEIQAI